MPVTDGGGTTLAALSQKTAMLPRLAVSESAGDMALPEASPLTIVAKQGRLLVRLSATVEALEARTGRFSALLATGQEAREQLADQVCQLQQERDDLRRATDTRIRQLTTETIAFVDALEWAATALKAQESPLAGPMAAMVEDGVRRLTTLGISEIAATGAIDGRLHEGVDTIETEAVPPYHIVTTVRRGWQLGDTVLRRSVVITATLPAPAPLSDVTEAAGDAPTEIILRESIRSAASGPIPEKTANHERKQRAKEREIPNAESPPTTRRPPENKRPPRRTHRWHLAPSLALTSVLPRPPSPCLMRKSRN